MLQEALVLQFSWWDTMTNLRGFAVAIVTILLVLGSPVLQAAQIVTLAGKKYEGELTRIDQGVVTLKSTSGPVSLPIQELHLLELNPAPKLSAFPRHDEIELVDGSIFRVQQWKIPKQNVELELLAGPEGVPVPTVSLKMGSLQYVMRNAHEASNRTEWKAVFAARGKRDQFVIRRASYEAVPGTVIEGNEEGDAITFERETGQRTTFKLVRATGGLIFNQPPRGEIAPTICKVHDVFGNVLMARQVTLSGESLTITTVSDAVMAYPSLRSVAKLDFSQGNLSYLSDLEPIVSAPEPFPGEPHFTYLRDRTSENLPMKLDGQAYAKGLWIVPDTTLKYSLDGDYREFKAVVGVDESIQIASSSVILRIMGDGKVLFAETIQRRDKPRNLTLDVNGVKELQISVDSESLFLGNQVNLAEARVQK